MADARVRQAPGWWASLVEAVCNDCGWRSQTYNLNDESNAWGQLERRVNRDAKEHTCDR